MLRHGLHFLILIFLTGTALGSDTKSLYQRGVQLIREHKYDEAINVLESALQNRDVPNQAPIYYFIGIALYQKQDYVNALSTFETAMDVSRNATLDNRIERYIDKVIRQQNFLASIARKHTLSYFVGAGYDSNTLKLNPDGFSGTELSAVSLIYGAGYSYRLVQTPDYSFIPELNISDNYSLSTKFQQDSTIQSGDALQAGLRLPFQRMINYRSPSDNIAAEVGYTQIYLPVDGSKRSLAFTTTSFQLSLFLGLTRTYSLNPVLYYAMDDSKITYALPDDSQTAKRSGIQINNRFGVGASSLYFLNLQGEFNKAEGRNQSYGKTGLETGIEFVGDLSRLRTTARYAVTGYNKRDDSRKDTLTSLGLDWTRNYSANKSLTASVGYGQTDSTVPLYKYNDLTLSLIFSDAFVF